MSTTYERQRDLDVPAPPKRDVGRWVVAASCVIFLVQVWLLRGFVTDDSWISVRYAETIGSGSGWGWNPGGEPVEGFSNPLLVMVEALAHSVGLDALLVARLIGVAAGLGCVIVVYAWGRLVVGDVAAAVAAVLTGTLAPLALWSVGGLETSIVCLLLTGAAIQLAREDVDSTTVAAWLLAPLPWLRPEALAVAGVLVVVAHVLRPWRRPWFRSLVAGLAPVLVSQALLQLVRWVVYGNVMPNSALYKVGTGDALEVPTTFLEEHRLLVIAAVLGVLLLTGRQWVLVVAPVVYLLGSIGTLDSANGWSRFLVPVLPLLALLAGIAIAAALAFFGLRQWWATTVTAALLVALAVTSAPSRVSLVSDWHHAYTDCKVVVREDMADWLNTTPEDTVFAISDAGLVPARGGGRTAIDNFLLNEAALQELGALNADERAERAISLRPDVLILASVSADRFDGVYRTDQLVHDHPQAAAYSLAHVAAAGGDCEYSLWAYQR